LLEFVAQQLSAAIYKKVLKGKIKKLEKDFMFQGNNKNITGNEGNAKNN